MSTEAAHNRVVAGIFAVGGIVGAFLTGQLAFLLGGGVLAGLFILPDILRKRGGRGDDGQ
ncbi:MAG: hypothetical protein GVY06_07560 [Alphaproteobacteria bacterium]|nr:hypothetical protein [Alphaproteobacteria bacterium]